MSETALNVTSTREQEITWRELLASATPDRALAAYLRFGPEEAGVQRGLEDLANVMSLVRSKSFNRAERILQRLEERGDWFNWDAFEADLARIREASAHIDERNLDEAKALLGQVGMSMFAAEVANMRGTARIFSGDLDEARMDFETALELDPQHYRAMTNLGNAALEAGELDEAIAYYERALRLNGDFPNAHHNLGVAWRKKGKIAKSIGSLKSGQRAQQRYEQAEAREQLGRMGRNFGGSNSRKYAKWLMYAVVAIGVYWFLTSRGTI